MWEFYFGDVTLGFGVTDKTFEMLRSTDGARTQQAALATFSSPPGMTVTSTSHSSIVQLADGSLVSVFSCVEFYNRTGTTDRESHLGAVKWRL